MVAAVATLEPEVAANMAHAAMFECISPPGSQGTHSTSALYMRSAMPERSRISPSSTKNGIATSRKLDRKSTRLNSSHGYISYAVFCLKKKKKEEDRAKLNNT